MLLQTVRFPLRQNIIGVPITFLKVALPSCTPQRTNVDLKTKLKLKEYVHCDYVDSKDYGIYALTTGYVRESAIEAGRITIARRCKTKDIWTVPSESPFTMKPPGTKRGGGKGKLSHWAAKAIAGQVLYEFNCAHDTMAKEAFLHVVPKLPVRICFRIKPKEPKTKLSVDELLDMRKRCNERKELILSYAPHRHKVLNYPKKWTD